MTTITRAEIEHYLHAAEQVQLNGFDRGKLITVPPWHMVDLARIALASLEAEPVGTRLPPRAPENLASCLDGYKNWLVATTFRDTWNACLAEVVRLNTGNSPVIPDGWVMVPKRLTSENGAKSLLVGEFSETKFISCPECFGDDECETCDGSGQIEITVPVSWTTIKAIWDKGVEHLSAAPKQE
ncbi:Eaa family phage protein [Trabulsiella guamensis ATCC 49490]|uniref:Eaa family phage protein n=1 Tax=Trabulsiella guamensis ATCC 49490 TaxID=1005994 RepID=A0A085ADJ3_9ENTR|nr:hypothetical protein [Trabulsiella guamensis]KFC08288.1 Eaa family phage protein [Trabulsiella guamensis ATCC 49490]